MMLPARGSPSTGLRWVSSLSKLQRGLYPQPALRPTGGEGKVSRALDNDVHGSHIPMTLLYPLSIQHQLAPQRLSMKWLLNSDQPPDKKIHIHRGEGSPHRSKEIHYFNEVVKKTGSNLSGVQNSIPAPSQWFKCWIKEVTIKTGWERKTQRTHKMCWIFLKLNPS